MILKKLIISLLVTIFGSTFGYLFLTNYLLPKISGKNVTPLNILLPKKEVIGFLPYWLITKASPDYSKYITTLSYFSLTLDKDGTIQKYTSPGQSEPGYHTLFSGKFDPFLASAKAKGLNLSLVVFSSGDDNIGLMLNDPESSAKNLLNDVTPIMKQYSFTDLNLDVEQVADASPEAKLRFTRFVQAVKNNLDKSVIKRLSLDISASAFIKDTNLADPTALVPLVDQLIVMAYDYHYAGSIVTGAVAPGEGAGTIAEFDTKSAIEAALKVTPAKKIILGIPLYGYEWDTLGAVPRSAVIPSTGQTISNSRAETFLASCATCSAVFDTTDKETHIIYLDPETGAYHQIFYPDKQSTQYKVNLAKENSLGGLATWALGYEGTTILEPLSSYHN
jgi:spore germination protein